MDCINIVELLESYKVSNKEYNCKCINGKDGKPGYSPYIGINGNWFEWDSITNNYIDSGIHAQGPKGDSGECKCNCYMYLGQWNGKATYPLLFNGCKVYVSSGDKMFVNLKDDNLNNNPLTTIGYWQLIFE